MENLRLTFVFAIGALGCSAPPPCEPGTRPSEDECAVEWSCVDGVQQMRCEDREEGGSECACLVDGWLQLNDGGAGRTFVTDIRANEVCNLLTSDLVALANEGCRWNVHFGP